MPYARVEADRSTNSSFALAGRTCPGRMQVFYVKSVDIIREAIFHLQTSRHVREVVVNGAHSLH